MKLYESETDAVQNEGIIVEIDGSIYDSLEEAKSYFPEGGVFAFKDSEGIRVAWTRQHEG